MNFTKEKLLAILIMLFGASFLSWLSLASIPIKVNDTVITARFGETIKDALKRNGFTGKVKLACLTEEGTYYLIEKPMRIFEGKKNISFSERIFLPEKLQLTFQEIDYDFKSEPKFDKNRNATLQPAGHYVVSVGKELSGVFFNKSPGQFKAILAQFENQNKSLILRQANIKGKKVIALTFDDGPSIYTREILNVLKKYKIKATFFVVGKHIEKHPDIFKEIVRHGHVIGNHSYSHRNLQSLKITDAVKDIETNEELIYKVAKVKPIFFRPPMGVLPKDLFVYFEIKGYYLSLWTVDSEDWKVKNPAVIYKNVTAKLRPGAVILFHDGGGNRRATARALETFINKALKEGYTFVTLEDIVRPATEF